jgi:GT2 family glycosyltransferase
MDSSKKITVIMPCYKNTEYTDRAIASLLRTSKRLKEIIIIENDPEGSTLMMLKERGYTCSILWNKENAGVSKSWNAGIYMSSTDLVAVANNDIEMITEGWDDIAVQYFEKNEKAAIVCSWPVGHRDEFLNPNNDPVEGLNGSFFVVSKEKVRETANFKLKREYIDTEYTPAYWEDADLLVQVRAQKYESYVLPSIKMVHFSNTTARQILPSHKGMDNPYWKNLDYFNKKYGVHIWDYFKVHLSNVLDENTNARLI